MRKFLLTPLLFPFLLPFTLWGQQRYYVNDNATGLNTGQSWADAFTDLHLALQPAQAGDEIWVAEGFYLPDTASDRNRTFTMPSGVRLLGGFAGTEQTAQERMPETHVTTLSGNIGNPADSTDNAFTVLYMAYPDENTYISGFTLEHGYAKSDTSFGNVSPYRAGGAVYVMAKDSTAYPVFDHCIFRKNYAGGNGGAVMLWGQTTKGCSPQFRYCKFENNSCGYNGGAIWFKGGSLIDKGIDFYACEFLNNAAGNIPGSLAGGVFYWKTFGTDTLEFNKCRMINNSARGVAGFLNVECSVPEKYICIDSSFISGNFVPGNESPNSSATFVNFEGSGNFSQLRKIRMTNNHFFDQPGALNGYIVFNEHYYNNQNQLTFTSNYFNNSPGVIIFDAAENTIIDGNVFFDSIRIGLRSKILQFSGNQFIGGKKHIFVSSDQPDRKTYFFNNLIINSASPDQYTSWRDNVLNLGFYNQASQDTIFFLNNTIMNTYFRPPSLFPPPTSNLKIYAQNNIFLNNYNAATGEKCLPFWHDLDQLDFDYNLTDFDCSTLSGLEVLCGDHNLIATTSPFVDTSLGDYHLLPCAQGINDGSPLFFALAGVQKDLQGDDRIQGTAPDIGPYEHKASVINGVFNTSISCGGSPTGSFSVQIGGGCPPYSIAWNGPGNSSGNQTDQLLAGQYLVTVSDSRGNILTDMITIGASDTLLIPTSFIVDAGGSGIANGAIVIVPEGGQSPYSALWSDGGTGLERTQILPGTYTVTVTDIQGCTATGTYNVGTVSANDIGGTALPKVWPNPASDLLYINGNALVSVSLCDATGRLVMEHNGGKSPLFILYTEDLTSGVYFLNMTVENQRIYRAKVIINR